MDAFTVLYDACVLYPAPLRDVLLEVAMQGLFRARWTDRIHDEWIRSLLIQRTDLTLETLTRTRRLMDRAIPDCLVSHYESLMEGLVLPDPDDRHVLTAAIKAKAAFIVTFNLHDFPEVALDPHGIKARHPDDFLVEQFDQSPDSICMAVKRLRARLKNPPMDWQMYFATLSRQRLPGFVEKLRTVESAL